MREEGSTYHGSLVTLQQLVKQQFVLTVSPGQKSIAARLVRPEEPMHVFEWKCGDRKNFHRQKQFAQGCTLFHIHIGKQSASLHCAQVLHV